MSCSALSSCQSSFTDFLSSLPEQASEIAMNTVNHLIEDQVGDPEKLESNFHRMKSVLTRCTGCTRLHGSEECGAGDCTNEEKKFLLSIPRKVRQHIWKYLDDASVKSLRSVCHQLKHEIDYDVGVSIVLTPETFQNFWMRSVSIRSCVVKRMGTIFTLNLFAKPEKLERISFDPEVFIDAEMAELVIRKFRNLRQIILYTEDVTVLKNVNEEATTNMISSKMISRLEDQFLLTSLDVKFDTTRWKLKWNIKLKPQVYEKFWEVEDVMGPFGVSGITRVLPQGRDLSKKTLQKVTLSIPFVQDRDRFVWLKVLHNQNSLVSFTCDLNATHWKDYEKIIRKNRKSLRKLFLMNFTDHTASLVGGGMEEEQRTPFDWAMFDGCNELEEITLIADTFLQSSSINTSTGAKNRRYMENTNLLCLLTCPKLRALWLENYSFSDDEVRLLNFMDPEKKDRARYELCTFKNCRFGSEFVEEHQAGSRWGRNRCMECLYFGTVSYDDDDLDAFEKYTALKLAKISENENEDNDSETNDDEHPRDMIEYFQYASQKPIQKKTNCVRNLLAENVNLLGGIAFTAWLAWTK